jgi:hypothetical protein
MLGHPLIGRVWDTHGPISPGWAGGLRSVGPVNDALRRSSGARIQSTARAPRKHEPTLAFV